MVIHVYGFGIYTVLVEHSWQSSFLFTDYETQGNEADKESIASVETTSLLQRLLPNSSPLSELQVIFSQL